MDFWWLAWQQQHITKVPGLNPTWWLNYVHFTDMERRGKARPLIFHRWGGLGNHRYQIGFSVDEIPLYAKAGSIIPLQPKMRNTGEKPIDPLILTIFPGDSGSIRIYEDQGNSLGYKQDEFAWTAVRHAKRKDGTRKIEIFPARGRYPNMLAERAYEIRLPGAWPPEAVSYNNQPVAFSHEETVPGWRYDGDKLMTIISLPKFRVTEKVEVLIKTPIALAASNQLLDGVPGKLARLRRVMPLLNSLWTKDWSPEILVAAAQTGNRISINPQSALVELQKLEREFPEVLNQVRNMQGDSTTIAIALGHLITITVK
ncbi:DUF5110 domain-containing protein [candidate division KSB1 bacterium]|nr:DUF5110 domain-containing protein [candidate division KSB1 bacterium]